MHQALISVSDKSGLVDFARGLAALNWRLIASGGSARALREAGLPVTEVAAVTGAPEMLGGRVKTLHPAIHAGILARDNAADRAELALYGIQPIDLVVCNLYPFRETVARPDVSLEEAVEQIDIGGVTLLRAAAKNFDRVTVLCDPQDYVIVLEELRHNGATSPVTRRRLALKAFRHTRDYDSAIAAYLERQFEGQAEAALPPRLELSLPLLQTMRYGENPHQNAAFYAAEGGGPLGGVLLRGKPLSYNNVLDLDAAWRAACSFDAPTVVIVKHLSPCGIASAEQLPQAFRAALASDPVSAFGGVIAVNRPFDLDTAAALGDLFVEAIAAPSFAPAACEHLAAHKPNCRLLQIAQVVLEQWELRSVAGGVLVQSVDHGDPPGTVWRTVTRRAPDEREMEALRMAWKVCQHVKSNAIVLVRDNATVGIGGGLPSRVDAARLAVAKAGERARGAVMASDAFFPFPDGVEVAAQAGVTAIIQPGGSVRDEEVIATADQLGIAMVFTGVRHFRH
ncbi:MAG: bifunctional phosphoribosylaminoimidazolecarboxamide formyltransferase/inosine monophosphate cyclohydrolase [Ardenticatenia bacterium]|nr:MAG: bifunctional phosphoribosylaminoimidazolecarboxamide formyltransferase/inosine monophosphate cyclohydrolase [Ardenticatenia bacterium]